MNWFREQLDYFKWTLKRDPETRLLLDLPPSKEPLKEKIKECAIDLLALLLILSVSGVLALIAYFLFP